MHEFALAKDIIETALTETKKHNCKRVDTLNVKLSTLSHITPDNLDFCLAAAANGTIAEKAKVKIETFDPEVKCQDCGNTFTFQKSEPLCTKCQSKKLEMVDKSEAFLESIEVN